MRKLLLLVSLITTQATLQPIGLARAAEPVSASWNSRSCDKACADAAARELEARERYRREKQEKVAEARRKLRESTSEAERNKPGI